MTLEKSEIQVRKADHLRICLENDVQFQTTTTGLEKYRFSHVCLPEIDRQNIDISTIFLGKKLQVPLLISSMTGGTDFAQEINYRLAEVAEYYQLAMGVGSQRIAVENPAVANTFAVRKIAPNIPLFANLGAVQLNYGYTISQCEKSIDLLEADALILHFNPLQEAIQTAGNTNFADLLGKIEQLCKCLPVPVIAKEVGNGISGKMALQLIGAGVKAIDVAGAGGTSWAKIEGERASHPLQKHLGETFTNWGLPTAECLIDVRRVAPQIPLIASGGLRNGLDVAKAIALGADLAGLAWPFLQAAAESQEVLHHLVEILIAEITTVLFCTGQINLSQLQQSEVLEKIS